MKQNNKDDWKDLAYRLLRTSLEIARECKPALDEFKGMHIFIAIHPDDTHMLPAIGIVLAEGGYKSIRIMTDQSVPLGALSIGTEI
jgi:hypothetical protein